MSAQDTSYRTGFRDNEDRAEFKRRDGSLTTVLEVLVSGEDDAEVRRVSVSNFGSRVDVQGWGDSVATLAYGDLLMANGSDSRQWYTGSFSGTSSASPWPTQTSLFADSGAR